MDRPRIIETGPIELVVVGACAVLLIGAGATLGWWIVTGQGTWWRKAVLVLLPPLAIAVLGSALDALEARRLLPERPWIGALNLATVAGLVAVAGFVAGSLLAARLLWGKSGLADPLD